jgi:hypothetical protein
MCVLGWDLARLTVGAWWTPMEIMEPLEHVEMELSRLEKRAIAVMVPVMSRRLNAAIL